MLQFPIFGVICAERRRIDDGGSGGGGSGSGGSGGKKRTYTLSRAVSPLNYEVIDDSFCFVIDAIDATYCYLRLFFRG